MVSPISDNHFYVCEYRTNVLEFWNEVTGYSNEHRPGRGIWYYVPVLYMVRPTYEKLLDVFLILVRKHTVDRPTHDASIGIRLVKRSMNVRSALRYIIVGITLVVF